MLSIKSFCFSVRNILFYKTCIILKIIRNNLSLRPLVATKSKERFLDVGRHPTENPYLIPNDVSGQNRRDIVCPCGLPDTKRQTRLKWATAVDGKSDIGTCEWWEAGLNSCTVLCIGITSQCCSLVVSLRASN